MEIRYENRVVLFLDILGFSNHIGESVENEQLLNSIYQAMNELLKYKDKFGKMPFREITMFSDSIVISYPYKKSSLIRTLHEFRDIILILLQYGFICRGGISFDKLYHKDSVVFGPAMIKAYQLETKHAVYPRVIISSEDIQKYKINCLECDIEKDDDGLYYFNIFKFFYSESGQMLELSKFIKEKLEEIIILNINNKDERIRNKYEWLSNKLAEGLKIQYCFIPVKD